MIITDIHPIDLKDSTAFGWNRLTIWRNPEFTSERLIRLHKIERKHHPNAESQARQIRSCLVQAEEYFRSASSATMATRPVLLYYGLMSLALAEVLTKATGDSRLAMLRQKHAGHGLSLVVDGSINRRCSLPDISARLRAAPQFDRTGQRFGTFEVWRRGVREAPTLLQYRETHGAIGAGTSGVRTFAIGEDIAPTAPNNRGYSLQDALRSLPQLRQLLTHFGMHTGCARVTISAQIDSTTKSGAVGVIIHPCDPITLEELYGRMLFEAAAVNSLDIREPPSGLILQYPLDEGASWAFRLRFPPGVAVNLEQYFFVTNDWDLGEFGSLYVALHIAGNLCRYYPDEWMDHLERSSSFSLAMQEVCEIAMQRAPLLTASELDRTYYIAAA